MTIESNKQYADPPQLDFLGGYLPENQDIQLKLWDDTLQKMVAAPTPSYGEVELFFRSIDTQLKKDYVDYWHEIKPIGQSAVFQRFLFAMLSVHTSWQANVTGYKAVCNWWEWLGNYDVLRQRLIEAKCGMHNNRAKFISSFATSFWENPKVYSKGVDEKWTDYRARLVANITGLGMAKVSFAIELCYPGTADVTCLDTHMFKAYKLDQIKHSKLYTDIERHWIEMSKMWGVPPYIARCLYWDNKQKQNSSKYWSHVFDR